jgi:hypothetical protein
MEAILRQLHQNFTNNTWLSPTNRYATDTIARIKADWGHLVSADLVQYVAASAPVHLLDGWAFLGRAVDAALRGDPDTTRHLAYYAELRAAISLLATEGIGVFNYQHFLIEQSMQPLQNLPSMGTHSIVWELLKSWSHLPRAASLVGQIVAVDGVSLSDWIRHFGLATGNALQPIAAQWLTAWGLDLGQFSRDHNARNVASYRPTSLVLRTPARIKDSFKAVDDIWSALEPTAGGKFNIIDSHLLRLTIEDISKSISVNVNAPSARKRYVLEVRRMVANAGPGGDQAGFRSFLLRRTSSKDRGILELARGTDPVWAPNHHLQVLSRAALLLRVAGGACALLLQSGGVSLSTLRFWWSEIGEARGCWDRASAPQDVTDLWADIADAMSEIHSKQSGRGKCGSLLKTRRDSLTQIAVLGECERIGLWGINV